MKTINKFLQITCLGIVILTFSPQVHGQLNNKVKTGNVLNNKNMKLTSAIPIKKISERDYKNIRISSVDLSKTLEVVVPKEYLKKQPKKTWKITPSRAFGTGNLGLRFFQGQLSREAFWIERDFVQGREIFYVAAITFDAQRGKNYLIQFKVNGVNSSSYIYAGAGGDVKIYGQNGSFILLVKAEEAGKMSIPFSARHSVGGNERYPKPLLVREVTIDEL